MLSFLLPAIKAVPFPLSSNPTYPSYSRFSVPYIKANFKIFIKPNLHFSNQCSNLLIEVTVSPKFFSHSLKWFIWIKNPYSLIYVQKYWFFPLIFLVIYYNSFDYWWVYNWIIHFSPIFQSTFNFIFIRPASPFIAIFIRTFPFYYSDSQ